MRLSCSVIRLSHGCSVLTVHFVNCKSQLCSPALYITSSVSMKSLQTGQFLHSFSKTKLRKPKAHPCSIMWFMADVTHFGDRMWLCFGTEKDSYRNTVRVLHAQCCRQPASIATVLSVAGLSQKIWMQTKTSCTQSMKDCQIAWLIQLHTGIFHQPFPLEPVTFQKRDFAWLLETRVLWRGSHALSPM